MESGKRLCHIFSLAAITALVGWASACSPTELVYTPVNPAFGGSPLNGSVLLNAAQAQNKTKDPDAAVATQTSLQ